MSKPTISILVVQEGPNWWVATIHNSRERPEHFEAGYGTTPLSAVQELVDSPDPTHQDRLSRYLS